jgi:hypothetical protein
MALGDNVEVIEPARDVPTEVTASVATEPVVILDPLLEESID